jgi:hypothetical protein
LAMRPWSFVVWLPSLSVWLASRAVWPPFWGVWLPSRIVSCAVAPLTARSGNPLVWSQP